MDARDDALRTLYRAPLVDFVAERARLAGALRAAGDGEGARELAKRRRPTSTAWAVNQLYWHARGAFDDMLAAAARVRDDSAAAGDYRETIAALRKRAATILTDAGQGAGETVLRRVATTLTALGAAGGFAPDEPGTLVADRDAPGFEAAGFTARPAPPSVRAVAAPRRDAGTPSAAEARARAAAERKRQEEEKRREAEVARRRAERHRLETRLRTARVELAKRERTLATLRREIGDAERAADSARRTLDDLERKVAALDDEA